MPTVLRLPRTTPSARVASKAQIDNVGRYSTDCIRDVAGFFALETEWVALEAQCADTCLFQSYAWCKNFVEHCGQQAKPDIRVFVVRDNAGLAAILPLAVQSDSGISVLTGLAEPYQQYTEMLLRPGCDAREVFGAILASIRKSGADYLHLGQVRKDSDLYRGAHAVVPASGEEDAAPYVPIGEFSDFDAYHQTVNAKTRKNLRNARNKLERNAKVRHVAARSGSELAGVIDRSFAGREAWLARQGLTSRAFRNARFADFLQRFKEPGLTGIDAIAFSLWSGEKPIADQWGFVYRRRYYAFMAGWDETFEEYSPGKLHLGAILAECHSEGIAVADFMIPAARYKFTWAQDAVPVQDYVMPLTVRGRIHNGLWLNLLRPLAKRAVYAIPKNIRARIFSVLSPGRA
jgi:CelD/BcsL family acetyltransferase involved in cellulose biosynthesis